MKKVFILAIMLWGALQLLTILLLSSYSTRLDALEAENKEQWESIENIVDMVQGCRMRHQSGPHYNGRGIEIRPIPGGEAIEIIPTPGSEALEVIGDSYPDPDTMGIMTHPAVPCDFDPDTMVTVLIYKDSSIVDSLNMDMWNTMGRPDLRIDVTVDDVPMIFDPILNVLFDSTIHKWTTPDWEFQGFKIKGGLPDSVIRRIWPDTMPAIEREIDWSFCPINQPLPDSVERAKNGWWWRKRLGSESWTFITDSLEVRSWWNTPPHDNEKCKPAVDSGDSITPLYRFPRQPALRNNWRDKYDSVRKILVIPLFLPLDKKPPLPIMP